MSYYALRTTAPTSEPISLIEAKKHLREDLDHNDELIKQLIAASRAQVESISGRALMQQTWTLTIDYELPTLIRLPHPPLQSVTSFSYVDTAGASQTLAADQYQVSLGGELLVGRVEPAYGVSWPSVRRQPGCATIVYVAGYASAAAVPEQAVQAMKVLMSHWYSNPDAVIVGTISSELPLAFNSLVTPLKVFG